MATTVRPGDRIPMSWDDYLSLGPDVRGEYVDGEFVMSPFPTGRHQDIAYAVASILKGAVPDSMGVREAWGWKPGADEFGPDVMVFDETHEDVRYTGVPHLVVEVLSTDPAADTVRKLRKYAEAGLPRYWIIDPTGPEIVEFRLIDRRLVEVARYVGSERAEIDVGVASVSLVPDELLD